MLKEEIKDTMVENTHLQDIQKPEEIRKEIEYNNEADFSVPEPIQDPDFEKNKSEEKLYKPEENKSNLYKENKSLEAFHEKEQKDNSSSPNDEKEENKNFEKPTQKDLSHEIHQFMQHRDTSNRPNIKYEYPPEISKNPYKRVKPKVENVK
jgi:hypothetical protein